MRVNEAVFFAVVSLGLCSSARAEVVDLKTLEKRALERHSMVQTGQARERAAAAGVREAQSGYMPRVGFNVDSNIGPGRNLIRVREVNGDEFLVQGVNAVTKDADKDETLRAIRPQWRSTANVVLGVNVYDFGRTSSAVAASRARHAAVRAEQELTREQVVGSVRQAYLAWLSSHELHRLSVSASEDSTRRTERVSALIQEGARPRGDLAPVESERLLSELELERAIGELEGARMALEATVGAPLPEVAEPDLAVLAVSPEAQITKRVDPALRLLAHQRAAAEATSRMQRRAGAPQITGNFGTGVGLQTNLGSDANLRVLPSYAFGLALSVPIWDGGATRASADATEARADELRIQAEDAELSRGQERARAKLDAEHAEKRQATALQLVEVCKTRVADTEAGYEMGGMQFEQVQQARSMLRRAETEVIMAKVARAEAVLRFAP